MGKVRVIEIHESVTAANDREAQAIREQMIRNKTLFLNVMSAPGSGKTTTLVALIRLLKDRYKIGGSYRTNMNAGNIQDGRHFLPIPISETNAAPGLYKQNPGW